jgi:hypothetical protein
VCVCVCVRCNVNINMKEVRCEVLQCMHSAYDTVKQRGLVNIIMKALVP